MADYSHYKTVCMNGSQFGIHCNIKVLILYGVLILVDLSLPNLVIGLGSLLGPSPLLNRANLK